MTSIDAAEIIVDLLRRGHAVQFRVRGGSMHPVIRDEDSIHVEPSRDWSVGDVLLTFAERGLTAHRVISRDAVSVTTRGDNAPGSDAPLLLERVLGVVTSVERAGRRRSVTREHPFRRLLRRLTRLIAPRRAGRYGGGIRSEAADARRPRRGGTVAMS